MGLVAGGARTLGGAAEVRVDKTVVELHVVLVEGAVDMFRSTSQGRYCPGPPVVEGFRGSNGSQVEESPANNLDKVKPSPANDSNSVPKEGRLSSPED